MPSSQLVLQVLLTGIGATAVTDLWALLRKRVFGVPLPNYGLVGRWFAHMPQSRFRHASIASATPMRGERAIGWAAHYAIGVAYAALLIPIAGRAWFNAPTLVPAVLLGIATVAAPFLLMQPGMGAGVAASRTPKPWTARAHSLVMHTVFGLGLYASGVAVA